MARVRYWDIVEISAIIISCLTPLRCRSDRDWWVSVSFCDSTYLESKEIYRIGEVIYVSCSEYFEAMMPETVEIVIGSNTGDCEKIKASPKGLGGIPEARYHGGYIQSYGSKSILQNNGIIEVHPSGDVLWAIYTVKGECAFDTAYIIPEKKGR